MLEKLTEEQTELIEVVREEWLQSFFSLSFDEEKAKELINWIYEEFLKYKKPLIFVLNSPFACQIGANLIQKTNGTQVGAQVEAQVGTQVRAQVRDQVWAQVWNQVGAQVWDQVGAQVWNQVGAQVEAQVGDQVRDQVWAQVWDQVRDQKLNYFDYCYYLNISDFYWISFYDYFKRIGILNHEKFEKYLNLIKSNIFYLITFKNIVFVSRMPVYIKRNEQNRLHCISGKAIEFKDGWGLYYLNGRNFTEQEFNKYIISEPKAKEIFQIQNQEKRAEVIKYWGYNKIVTELSLKCISDYKINGDINYLFTCKELPINLLEVVDSTTKKHYILGVSETQTDCLEAIAWTFNMNKEEYKERIES